MPSILSDMKEKLKLDSLTAEATNVILPIGLAVETIRLTLGHASTNLHPFLLEMDNPAQLEVTVLSSQIAAFLEKKSPGNLRDISVKIDDGFVSVEATTKLIVDIRVTAVCTLRISDETQLFVDLDSVSVKAPMAKSLVEQQLEKINPILNIKDIGLEGKLEKVVAENGSVLIFGLVKWAQSK